MENMLSMHEYIYFSNEKPANEKWIPMSSSKLKKSEQNTNERVNKQTNDIMTIWTNQIIDVKISIDTV